MHWFRRNQKRVLIPLAIIVIPSFVLVSVVGGQGGDNESAIVVGDNSYSLKQFREYTRCVTGLNPRYRASYASLAAAVTTLLQQSCLAERSGIRVAPEHLKTVLRQVVKNTNLPAPENLEEEKESLSARHRRLLSNWGVTSTGLKEFLGHLVAAETYRQIAVDSNDFISDKERMLDTAASDDELTTRARSFSIKKYIKEVTENEPPTDAEIEAFYNASAQLPTKKTTQNNRTGQWEQSPWSSNDSVWELLLLTTPEVGCEYSFINKATAEKAAKNMLAASKTLAATTNTEAAGSTVATDTASLVADINYNERLKSKYEQVKETKFKKEEKDAEGKAQYRTFDEVKAELAKLVEKDVLKTASRDAANGLSSKIEAHEVNNVITTEAATLGLGGAFGVMQLANSTSSLIAANSITNKFGGQMGYTGLQKEPKVGQLRGKGNFRRMGRSAITSARSDEPVGYQVEIDNAKGSVIYRPAQFEESRLMTLQKATEIIRTKLIHIKAARKASDEAKALLRELVDRKLKIDDLKESRTASASDTSMAPYQNLAIGEPSEEPFAMTNMQQYLNANTKDMIRSDLVNLINNADGELLNAMSENAKLLKTQSVKVGFVVKRKMIDAAEFDPLATKQRLDMSKLMRSAMSSVYLREAMSTVEVVKKDALLKEIERRNRR